MTSKFELTISTNYVPDWTFIEAFRELFQNAIDNEIENPENKMEFEFNDNTIRISNKTSVLEIDSLLLGNSTKQNSINTIGKHGEGYKIAFMVLLREGKGVKVYNYGKREIWEARLVKSKRFNGELIPTIFVQKEAVWKKVPNNNLIIEVTDVSELEFKEIKRKNLNLQSDVEYVEVEGFGRILTDKDKEAGNIYVKGLFICNNPSLKYGYDFEPKVIQLDRDRKLMSDFNIQWNSSSLWKETAYNGKLHSELTELLYENAFDVKYILDAYVPNAYLPTDSLVERLVNKFVTENSEDSTPVTSNEELKEALEQGLKPVIVPENVARIIADAPVVIKQFKKLTIKEKFKNFLDKIENKLTDEELEEFEELIQQL